MKTCKSVKKTNSPGTTGMFTTLNAADSHACNIVAVLNLETVQMKTLLLKSLIFAITFVVANLVLVFNSLSETYYLTSTGAGSAQTASNWNTDSNGGGTAAANFTTNGDVFIIISGISGIFKGTTTFETGVTLQIEGTGTASVDNDNAGYVLTIKGTLIFTGNSNQLYVEGNKATITLGETINIKTSNTSGVYSESSSGNTQSINGKTKSVTLPSTGSYEFNGVTQSMTGLPGTVNNLTLSGSGTKTLNGSKTINGNLIIGTGTTLDVTTSNYNINLAGNWTNNGTFTPQRGTVSFTSNTNVTQIIAGNSTFYNLSKPYANSTLSFGSGTTTIANNLSFTAGTMDGATSTIIFTGSNASLQGAGVKTFYNLQINNGAILTQTSGTNININNSYTNNGTFTQDNTRTITFQTASQSLAGNGTSTFGGVKIENPITVNAYSHNFSVTGTFDITNNSGIFNGGTATVTFSGASAALGNSSSGVFNFNNITIATSANLTNTNKSFNISGNWTNNGTYTKGTETVTFNGSTAQAIGGSSSTIFNHLTLSGTGIKTIQSGSNIECNNLTIASGASLTIASTGAAATGSLKVNGTKSISGTVNVQRWIPSDGWHIVSSPVSGQGMGAFSKPIASGGNNLGWYIDSYDLAPYSESLGDWSPFNVVDGTTTTFGEATGYLLRLPEEEGSRAVTFSGTGIFSGAVTKTLGTIGRNGWNAVGNPYTTPISASTFLSTNTSNLNDSYEALYLWDNTLVNGTGDYAVTTTGNIAVGQGFVIKRSGEKDDNTTVDISFTTGMQTTGATFKSGEIPNPEIKLWLSAGKLNNVTSVNFISGMTNDLDPGYDVGKLKGNPDIALYTKLISNNSNVDFAIQALPGGSFESVSVPVGLDLKGGGLASFTIEKSASFPKGAEIYLEDKTLGKLTLLSAEDAKYEVNLPAMAGFGRFNLVVKNYAESGEVTSIANQVQTSEYVVFTRQNLIFVNGAADKNTLFSLYGIDGKLWRQKKAESQNRNMLDGSSLPAGIYLLRIEKGRVQQTHKVVLTGN